MRTGKDITIYHDHSRNVIIIIGSLLTAHVFIDNIGLSVPHLGIILFLMI